MRVGLGKAYLAREKLKGNLVSVPPGKEFSKMSALSLILIVVFIFHRNFHTFENFHRQASFSANARGRGV